MLGILRKYKQSVIIKVVFGAIVLTFVGTIFLVWGKGDRETQQGGDAATVGKTKISFDEFQRSYYRLRGIYEQLYGRSLTPELEKTLGVKKMALDSLIDNALVTQEADRMGIKVSKDEIAAAIAAIPAFQKDGAFDFQQYQQVLRGNRMTPQQFEDAQEKELRVKKAREKIKEKATVSDDEALKEFRKKNDTIDLAFVAFAPADVRGEVKLTEQDLKAYLQNNPEPFKEPEQASIAFVLLEPAKVATKLAVSEEEAQAFYQKNIDRYQEKGEILPYAAVKERAKVDALQNKAAKQAYEQAADVFNKNLQSGDLKAAAAALGGSIQETPLFTAKNPPPILAAEAQLVKRVFAGKQGELGGPVETPRGIYLFKVKEKKPAAVPPFEKIKAQVEARAGEEKARELAKKKAEEALAQMAKGGTGLKLQETGPFGFAPTGLVPKIGPSPELMEAAFDLTGAAPVAKTPLKVTDRWVAVKLKSRSEPDTAAFQKQKDELKKALLPKKQQEELDKWLKELRAKTKIQTNQALLTD